MNYHKKKFHNLVFLSMPAVQLRGTSSLRSHSGPSRVSMVLFYFGGSEVLPFTVHPRAPRIMIPKKTT